MPWVFSSVRVGVVREVVRPRAGWSRLPCGHGNPHGVPGKEAPSAVGELGVLWLISQSHGACETRVSGVCAMLSGELVLVQRLHRNLRE